MAEDHSLIRPAYSATGNSGGVSAYSKEHFFLKGLNDLEKALDELVEASRRSSIVRPPLQTLSVINTYNGPDPSETITSCYSTDSVYLRLHEVRVQVINCKSKLKELLPQTMQNQNSDHDLDHQDDTAANKQSCRCERACKCNGHGAWAPAPAGNTSNSQRSGTNEQHNNTNTNTNTNANANAANANAKAVEKQRSRNRRRSAENSSRFSLACCALPLRLRKKTLRDDRRQSDALLDSTAAPEQANQTLAVPYRLVALDNVIGSFLKSSNDELPEKNVHVLRSIRFDNFIWADQQLMLMVKWMFTDLELLHEFGIGNDTFDSWICAVYRHYNPVPYHNFSHAFMVVQMVYALICQLRLTRHFSKLEQFALLTSALVHDLDHPGLNNAYQVNAGTALALLYNDLSPLENHHCATTFQLLQQPQCNILSKLSNEQYKEVRSSLVNCVLATDMAKHFEICRNVEKELTEQQNKQSILDWNRKDHRNNMAVLLIKWADISNEVRPLEVASKWTDCLLAEFFRQGDLEKEMGLPISPLMDRQKTTRITAQVNFIENVLSPLADLMVRIFPQLDNDFSVCLRGKVVYYKSLENFDPKKNQKEEKPAT